MRPELELYEQIDRYLNNMLSAEEKSAFELRMSQDAELQEAVQMADITRELIVESALQKEKIFLKQLESEYHNSSTNWKIISGVVLGVVLTAAAFIFWPESSEVKEQAIRNEAIVPVENNTESLVEKENFSVIKEKSTDRKQIPLSAETVTDQKIEEEISTKENSDQRTELLPEKILPKEEVKEKAEVKETAKVSCADQLKGVSFATTPSCKKEPTGTIEVKGVVKGISLFLDEESISSREGGLNSGKHILVVKNSECIVSHTITIGSVSCISNKTLSWSLSDQDHWTIELAQEDGKLILMDRSGRILKEEMVSGNLYSVSSETISSIGVYQFRIIYPDGEAEQGYIQIVP